MSQSNEAVATLPVPSRDVLTGILREGAQRLLARAIDAEVDDWIARHVESKDQRGRQLVVKNGHHPTRTLVTGVGPVEVSQPRVLDRRIVGQDEKGQDIDAAGPAGDSVPPGARRPSFRGCRNGTTPRRLTLGSGTVPLDVSRVRDIPPGQPRSHVGWAESAKPSRPFPRTRTTSAQRGQRSAGAGLRGLSPAYATTRLDPRPVVVAIGLLLGNDSRFKSTSRMPTSLISTRIQATSP